MKIVFTLAEIRKTVDSWRAAGERLALVPTMGCLHPGHLALMRAARRQADKVIVSIFVNPMQFGPGEDFDAYPRQFADDCRLAAEQGVAAVFNPGADEMYGPFFQTRVSVAHLSQGMCGTGRPGHFDGVATVVSKLFQLTTPHLAVFGEKDLQQLAIIRQLVRDLNFPVEIIGHPIVRDPDGLAMSSRNRYLSAEDRQRALCLYQSIGVARALVSENQQAVTASRILAAVTETLARSGVDAEYAVVVNQHSLEPEEVIGPDSVLALAARITRTVRLIDNGRLIDEE